MVALGLGLAGVRGKEGGITKGQETLEGDGLLISTVVIISQGPTQHKTYQIVILMMCHLFCVIRSQKSCERMKSPCGRKEKRKRDIY